MLVGGDLGFSNLVLVVGLFVFPVVGFLLRRKWRLATARTEEVKRLLVLASEESARVELEVSAGYGATPAYVSQQLLYQCAVCFCPTTTRCARCKAVRYCSGKCQIVHWRRGHKDECSPFTNFDQSNEREVGFSQKVFNQDEYENDGNSFKSEGKQFAKPVASFPEEYTFSDPDISKVTLKKDNVEAECLADEKETHSSIKFSTHPLSEQHPDSTTCREASFDASGSNSNDSDGLQSSGVPPNKLEANCANMDGTSSPLSGPSSLGISIDNSAKFSQTKPVCSDGDARSRSSSSSGWSVDGSNDSLSEPSTPSSGFWEGASDSKMPKNDGYDDCAQSSSSDSSGDMMSGRRSSIVFSFDLAKGPPVDEQGSGIKTMISNDGPYAPVIKKHIDEAALLEELPKHDLKSRTSSSLSSETSNRVDIDACSGSCVPNSRQLKSSASSSYYASPDFSTGRHTVTKTAKKLSSSLASRSESSSNVVTDTSSSLHALRRHGIESLPCKASDASLSSSNVRDSGRTAVFSEVDNSMYGVNTCSSQLPGYSQNARNGLKTPMLKVVDQLQVSKLSRHHQVGAGSETAGRYTSKGLFPYELFVKLYNWNKVEMHPCGLINCGNSCYANVVLQCLAFTPPLTAYHLQGLHSKSCEKKEWCFTCEFESLILKAKGGNSSLSPIKILSHIKNIGNHLGYGREEDAHEFLRYAIDTMQSVCLKEACAKTSGSVDEETTLVGLTFGGYLRSKIKCMKCGGKSERHERMMDLTVEIDGNICTLEEALRQFTGTEILDDENKYQCSRCKSYEKAKKKLTIVEAPNVLTIALKRFQSGKFGKLNKPIQFPEILDMAPYMSGASDKSPIYRLYGVVVHLDTMNASFSGHYVCYVKNIQNKWFKIDDSMVSPVELERVLTKGAYMLLYARCSPRAPKLIRNSMVPRDPRKSKNSPIKSRSHLKGPCDTPAMNHLNCQTTRECFYPDHPSIQPVLPILDEDSLSDKSSSFFSEAGSCSTESSNRDSTSADDYFDQIFGDLRHNWSGTWRNSSDSDTSSSSSSPSPLGSRRSPLSNSDRYASKYPDRPNASGFRSDYAESAGDGKGRAPFLHSDMTKQCRNLYSSTSSSSSCRETDSDRLRRLNPLNDVKYGISHRSSMHERTD